VRNIGGAIGIAVMDTVMFSRTPEHADRLLELSRSAPERAAPLLGISAAEIPEADDAMGFLTFGETLQAAALTFAINECFWMLALASILILPLLWVMGPLESARPVKRRAN
jgi:DHA2 family multidrug resistance protein